MPDPSASVCVVGSVNMDLVVRTPRLPGPGETVLGSSYRSFPGGKGANQAVAAARLGAQVSFIGALGDDPHGAKLRAVFQAEGVNLDGLHVRAGEATGLGLITVADGGENTIVVSSNANATLTPAEVRAHAARLEAADVLLMQLEVPLACNVEAAQVARAAGASVILNAAPARAIPKDLVRLVDVLVVNRPEAASLLGLDPTLDPARLALRLPDLGVSTVILTIGAQGAILSHRGRPRRVPTLTVESVDSVGAGDAFCGGLAAQWPPVAKAIRAKSADEMPLLEAAALHACVAGALASTKAGAIPSLPSAAEVQAKVAGLAVT